MTAGLMETAAQPAEARSGVGRRRGERMPWRVLLLLAPALVFLGVVLGFPLIDVLMRSFEGPAGFTFDNYTRIVERSLYLRVFWITIEISFLVTIVTLALGYPVAYVLARSEGRWVSLAMAAVLMPFFTSILVRTYSWMVILGPEGLLNQNLALFDLGPVTLIYNRIGVVIGMTYALLPYMILTLYAVMRGIDPQFERAALSLGASEWQGFRRIFLPLSLPGVMGGALLVFILSLGYFITPRLMGGDADQTIAAIIDYQIELALNWSFGSALAVVLLLITIVGFIVYDRLVGLQSMFENKQ